MNDLIRPQKQKELNLVAFPLQKTVEATEQQQRFSLSRFQVFGLSGLTWFGATKLFGYVAGSLLAFQFTTIVVLSDALLATLYYSDWQLKERALEMSKIKLDLCNVRSFSRYEFD